MSTDKLPPVSARRPGPPKVAPVILDGIRYEQALRARDEGTGQRTGWLAATREASGERLWIVRVYELTVDARLEADVQDVYFATLAASADGREILVVNERGDRFAVDVRTQAIRAD